MAFNATAVWEVRNGGSDTQCGGGFDAAISGAGTDYSQQSAAQATGTVTSSTTTVTATTGIFTSAMVGNVITDGTTYKFITGFTSSTVVTVDSAPSWTGATIYVGGALATPGKAAGLRVLGNTVYIKYNASPFVITTSSSNVAAGIINITYNGSDTVLDYWIGYDTTRTIKNMDTNKPTIQIDSGGGVSSVTVFRYASASTVHNLLVRNIIIDGNLKTAIKGFSTASANAGNWFHQCEAINCTNSGFAPENGSMLIGCVAAGCSTQPAFDLSTQSVFLFGCIARNNTITGFSWSVNSGCALVNCISYSNSGGSSDGFAIGAGGVGGKMTNCTAYNNGRDGFRFSGSNIRGAVGINCLSVSNAGYGFNDTGSPVVSYNCAGYNNTSGNENAITQSFSFVTLTADPFVDAPNGNFALNNASGGGALLRQLGFPGTFPDGTTTGYTDIGAVQSRVPTAAEAAAAAWEFLDRTLTG